MLKIGNQTFKSRLLLGTGKYPSFEIQKSSVEVSEAEILTFAVRRMNIFEESQPNFLEQLDLKNTNYFPILQEQKLQKKPLGSQGWQRLPVYVT